MTMIFIVENEKEVLVKAHGDLRSKNLTVYAATCVENFHTLLATGVKPDAVISDYFLDNGETGKQIWHATRGKYPKLPFIGTSSEVTHTWKKIVDSNLDEAISSLPKKDDGTWDTNAMEKHLEKIGVIPPDIPF